MVWTVIGWIDQGEDPDDYYSWHIPEKIFCKECGARINMEPQIIISQRIYEYPGEEWIEKVEHVWWECPRCMAEYDSIETFGEVD